jgi:hypothetical protein
MTSPFASSRSRRGTRRRALAGSLVAGLVLLPRGGSAQTVPVELTWSAPAECPSRAAVLARVRDLVGAAAEGATPVRASGEIRKVGSAFELRLLTEQEGQRGERLVRSAQCDDLRGVAAVALTLLLTTGTQPGEDADGGSGSAPSDAGTLGATPAPSRTPPTLEPVPEPEPPPPEPDSPERSWRFLLATPQLALQIGPLPRPTPALSIGFGIEGAGWSARLLGQWGAEQRLDAPIVGYGAEAQRAALGLWACTEHRAGFVSVAPCVQGSVARLRARGYGPFLSPSSRQQVTWAVGVGVIGRAHLTRWLALMMALGGQIELQRPDLRVDSSAFYDTVGRVGRLAPVSALVVVGPEWIF